MSHFTTTVVIKSATDPKDAQTQAEVLLAPFSEELDVPHTEWYETIDSAIRDVLWWRHSTHLSEPEKAEYDQGPGPEPTKFRTVGGHELLAPEWVLWLKAAIQKHWGDEDGVKGDVVQTRPAENGEQVQFGYISTYNPDSKWDWYSLGGRWRGYWPVRPGVDPAMWEGSAYGGVFNSEKRFDADCIRKGDIDFEYRLNQVTAEAERDFDKWEALTDGIDPTNFVPWKTFLTSVEAKTITIDEARQKYGAQAVVQRMRADHNTYGPFSSPEDFFWGQDNARERYVSEKRAGAFSSFALLDEEGWHEKGHMGWFGMTSDEKDERDWGETYQKVIDALPDDAWLLNYDLHI